MDDFHAALEAPWEQLFLWSLAGLVRMGLIRSWSSLIPLFNSVSQKMILLGSDRGGMSLDVHGKGKDQQALHGSWQLLARNNHGPEIPCTPALVLVDKLLHGDIASRGATPCLNLFGLHDFAKSLQGFDVAWQEQYFPAST